MGYGARLRVIAGVVYNDIADEENKLLKAAIRAGLAGKEDEWDDSKIANDGMMLEFCQNNDPGSVRAFGAEIGVYDNGEDFYDNLHNSVQGVIGFGVDTLQTLVAENAAKIAAARAYWEALPEKFRKNKLLSKFGVYVIADIDE
jgi:hypothetical protein